MFGSSRRRTGTCKSEFGRICFAKISIIVWQCFRSVYRLSESEEKTFPSYLASSYAEQRPNWKVPVPTLSENALRHLMTYDFPGNIRELRNLIERAGFWRTAASFQWTCCRASWLARLGPNVFRSEQQQAGR